jgi:DNA-directed RNA polymerase sigma subunit (sigma70/sigma32)
MSSTEKRKAAKKAYQERIRLKPGELNAAHRGGRFDVAIRSMSEVARMMGITRSAVHQLERNALHKLRLALEPYRSCE